MASKKVSPKSISHFAFVAKVATMGDKRLLIIPKAMDHETNKLVGKHVKVNVEEIDL